jgi:hypothetical protein
MYSEAYEVEGKEVNGIETLMKQGGSARSWHWYFATAGNVL